MSLPQMITDRTQADVDRLLYLIAKGCINWTPEEEAEYSAGMKGAYNASDLNRVGAAIQYIADRLNGFGYGITVNPKTDFVPDDETEGTQFNAPTPVQMTTYLSDLRTIREYLPATLPPLPDSMNHLTFAYANNIERMLELVDELIDKLSASFVYCGQPYSGMIWTQFT